MMKEFPDVTELLDRKQARRRELAALPFEEKIAILMRMRERSRFLRNAALARTESEVDHSKPQASEEKMVR